MDFLPKRNNLSTEALIPPMPVANLLNETRYTLGSSALFRLEQACSNKKLFRRQIHFLEMPSHCRIHNTELSCEPVRGWYQISKSKHVPLVEHLQIAVFAFKDKILLVQSYRIDKNYEYAREPLYLLKGMRAERVIGMIRDKHRNLN